MRVPTQNKDKRKRVVGLCQKSAGLCFLKQTPQPRKTAHWLKGGEGGQAKLPKHTNPLHIGMEAPQQRMRERSRTRTTPVSHYSLGFVCPSPQSSARTGPCLFLLSLLPMRVPTQNKDKRKRVVGLCQKSAGLCFLKQTPQPRKTAHLPLLCSSNAKEGFWHSPHLRGQAWEEAVPGRLSWELPSAQKPSLSLSVLHQLAFLWFQMITPVTPLHHLM